MKPKAASSDGQPFGLIIPARQRPRFRQTSPAERFRQLQQLAHPQGRNGRLEAARSPEPTTSAASASSSGFGKVRPAAPRLANADVPRTCRQLWACSSAKQGVPQGQFAVGLLWRAGLFARAPAAPAAGGFRGPSVPRPVRGRRTRSQWTALNPTGVGSGTVQPAPAVRTVRQTKKQKRRMCGLQNCCCFWDVTTKPPAAARRRTLEAVIKSRSDSDQQRSVLWRDGCQRQMSKPGGSGIKDA